MGPSEKTYNIVVDVKFFFTDTGAPPNSNDYTTLVAIHGLGVPGATFERIQSHAHAYNFRIVALNRRDYAGSSPISDELATLRGKDEPLARKFFDNMGLHLALFIKKLVEEEDVPPILGPENEKRRGGIAVMGWSQGTMTAIAPFGNPGHMDEAVYQVLEKYVKDLILYDPPFSSLGLSPSSSINAKNLYFPGTDPSLQDPVERTGKFAEWVGSYFHYTWRDGIPTTESIEETGLLKRTVRSTADLWTESEFGRYTDSKPTSGAEIAVLGWSSIVNELAHNALFDEKTASSFFPKLSITYLYAPCSTWMCIVGYTETKRLYEERVERNEGIRPIKFVELEGANHFEHFTNPKQFLQTVKSVVA
ncbi:hypothetical protein PQX77_008099 [Marasmius sp. AFHP31]|nr:hypothetical protein PQX77_008099 [Marasmius sp. AFHP31]